MSDPLPQHFAARLPIAVSALAKALRRAPKTWVIDARLGSLGVVACEPADADIVVEHYRKIWAPESARPVAHVIDAPGLFESGDISPYGPPNVRVRKIGESTMPQPWNPVLVREEG